MDKNGTNSIDKPTEQFNIKNRFLRLFETSQWSDCRFVVKDEEFHVHRLVLATSSPVFEVMFYGPLAEGDVIRVTDMSAVEFKQLLQFIYTDNVTVDSVDNAWRLLYAAKKYLLTLLTQQCIEYIMNNLSAENVLSSYELAEMYDEKVVQNTCIDMIRKYTPLVLNCDYHMSATTLCMILNQDNLNASEFELVCTAITWSEDECTFREIPCNQKNKRALLIEAGALSKLRLITLPILCHDVQSALSEILSKPEIQLLEQYAADGEQLVKNGGLLFDFNCDRQQRFSVALPYHTASRWILKGAAVLRVTSVNASVKTHIFVNRRVLVYSFNMPTRLAPRWITHIHHNDHKYTEAFYVSVTDTRTNTPVVPETLIKTIALYCSSMKVKLNEPALFESGVTYQLIIKWPFENFDLNGYEYSLDCLSTNAERKGVRFTMGSEYDLIQSISYSPFCI